jgi:hypothetical protein
MKAREIVLKALEERRRNKGRGGNSDSEEIDLKIDEILKKNPRIVDSFSIIELYGIYSALEGPKTDIKQEKTSKHPHEQIVQDLDEIMDLLEKDPEVVHKLPRLYQKRIKQLF